MKVNGFQIREALKRWEQRRKMADGQFRDSLHRFEGEQKRSPVEVIEAFRSADESYAKLQELQQWFNQQVKCNVGGEEQTLSYCVKIIGGAGRIEKLWRDACAKKRDRYSYRDDDLTRSKDTEYATRAISVQEASEQAEKAGRFASQVRTALAVGNATNVDVSEFLTQEQYDMLFN